jgi:hypothetical protein
MLKAFFSFVARLYTLLISIALSVIMGFAVWVCWEVYIEEKSAALFLKEGQRILVKVEEVSTLPHSWRDYVSNTTYLTFQYKQEKYEARFMNDRQLVSAGDSVYLLYHSQLDTFRQVKQVLPFNQSQPKSRLIKWSVINTFNPENRWLVLSLTFSAFFFLYTCGVVVSITGWNFLQTAGRFVGIILLIAATLFLSYDCWTYYQYYQRVKTNGQQAKATIIHTDRNAYSSRQSRDWKWYMYTAKVDFQGQEKIIPIQEKDYALLKPGDELLVLNEEVLKEVIPVDYPIDYRQFWLAIFFWLMSFFVFYRQCMLSNQTNKAPRM